MAVFSLTICLVVEVEVLYAAGVKIRGETIWEIFARYLNDGSHRKVRVSGR